MRVQVVGAHDPGVEAVPRHRVDGERSLPPARLDDEVSAGSQPPRRLLGDPAMDVHTVGSAVEGDPRLVVARLRRHHRDLVGRHVRRVHDDDVDASGSSSGSASVRSPSWTLPMPSRLRRAQCDGAGLDVGRVQLDVRTCGVDGRGDRARAAAELHDDGVAHAVEQRDRLLDQQGRPASGHEHTRLDDDAQTAELGPAQHLLQRQAGDAALDHRLELVGRRRGLDDQRRLVLGEHAARRTQARRDEGLRQRAALRGASRAVARSVTEQHCPRRSRSRRCAPRPSARGAPCRRPRSGARHPCGAAP